jgi:segregation and condensation protein B
MSADEPVPTQDAPAQPAPAGAQELRLEPELRKALEAILLVVDEPVDVEILAQVLEVGTDDVEDGLLALAAEYVEQGRGFVLRRAGGGWRLYTDPGAASYVEKFVLHGRTGKLSQAALETLAIIAYKQPVTRMAISDIRGVDADTGVRNLLNRGLVEEVGRADQPGQPLLYGTTGSFLEKLGIDDLDALPALPDLSPAGPPPPEPAPGRYKEARKEMELLGGSRLAASGPAGTLDGEGTLDLDGAGAMDADDDAGIDAVLRSRGPKPGSRLAALLDDPFGPEAQDDEAHVDDDPAVDIPDPQEEPHDDGR